MGVALLAIGILVGYLASEFLSVNWVILIAVLLLIAGASYNPREEPPP